MPEKLSDLLKQKLEIKIGDEVSNIIFTKQTKPDGTEIYKSSDPKRKMMELDPNEAIVPEPGAVCTVEIIKDTKPKKPNKGKYVVKIVDIENTLDGEPPTIDLVPDLELPHPVEYDPETNKIYVLDVELEFNKEGGPHVPKPEKFKHFTLDSRTLEVVRKAAIGVELKQPTLIEGETSTSKTSSIEYLAMLTNNNVIRFNLNGQTDTSEMIGKFIPNDGQLQIEFEQLIKQPELLTKESVKILNNAKGQNRGLTKLESQQLAKNEGLEIPEWRWQDGFYPLAMKNGWWLIKDELYLGEPNILERGNSVLEKDPSLTITEKGGEIIGPGGDFEVHPNFRIFATTNPAEYSGRIPPSPAYKNRWINYMFAQEPTEDEYNQMFELLVYGKQPDVEIDDVIYEGETVEPLYKNLQKVPQIKKFLKKLAKFHAKAEAMAKKNEIGRGREEKYIFTRRNLIELLNWLQNKKMVQRKPKKVETIKENPKKIIRAALKNYYVDHMANETDRKKLEAQLDMIKIGMKDDNWNL